MHIYYIQMREEIDVPGSFVGSVLLGRKVTRMSSELHGNCEYEWVGPVKTARARSRDFV